MSKIPDSLMTRPLPSVDTMNIDTSILEPLVASTTFCRFQMERRGILDSGSSIQIGIVVPGLADLPASAVACLPIKTGIHCAVKRAILRIGEKVIAITDDYAKYATIHRAFKTTEEKSQKEMVTKGCIDVLCPDLGTGGAQSNGKYELRDVESLNLGAGAMSLPFSQFRLAPTVEETPFFHIKLSELFPMMKNIQLPLYLIDQPCVIELFFNTQNTTNAQYGTLACIDGATMAGVGAGNSLAANVAPDSLRFLCDYLTYTDERMSQTAQMVMSNDGLTIPYEDVVTTNSNFGAGAVPSTLNVTRDLGVSSMSLRAILGHYGPNDEDDLVTRVQGPYASVGFKNPETIQIRLNDKQVYQRPLKRETQKQDQISQVFGTDLSILNSEFSFDSVVEKDTYTITNPMMSGGFLGYDNDLCLQGSQHYMGVDFSSPGNYGVTIGQKPIQVLTDLNYTDAQDAAGRVVTYYSLVERTMRLKGGLVEVSS
jgi:hypothetical protein